MIVIIGHGPSIVSKRLGPWLDEQTVVRLKKAEIPNTLDWGSRTDYTCATSTAYRREFPFWLLPKRQDYQSDTQMQVANWRKWREFYRRFSTAKPSTGLCAIFCAVEFKEATEIGLAGFDNLLYPENPGWSKWWLPRYAGEFAHDARAEHACIKSLGIKAVDVCQNSLNTTH